MNKQLVDNIVLFTLIMTPIIVVIVIINRTNTISSYKRAYLVERANKYKHGMRYAINDTQV